MSRARGSDLGQRLGRHRRVVESSLSGLLGCCLGVPYERRATLLQGLLHLACALIGVRCLSPPDD